MAIPVYKGMRKEPMSEGRGPSGSPTGPRGSTPRYTYTSPTLKTQHPFPENCGTDINNYLLPAVDVQRERRNYPGYDENQVHGLEDILQGDFSGTTDTDYATHEYTQPQRQPYLNRTGGRGGYTRINQRSGGKGRSWKTTSARKGIN